MQCIISFQRSLFLQSILRCIPVFLFTMFVFSAGTIALAGQKQFSPQPKVIYPVKQGLSRPLREMKAPRILSKVTGEEAVIPLRYPQRKKVPQLQKPVMPMQESTIQQSVPVGLMPTTSVNFEGLDNIAGYYPPDTCGDVGPNHYVQVTNVYYQVYDKTTGAAMLPAALPNNAMWSGFGGVCETTNHGDPIVLYDQFADRWLFSQFSINGPFHQCIAISQTGDPTGAWYRYDYELSSTIMNDYPHFGVWSDGYYMSINQFDSTKGYSWAGQGVVAFDRAAMLTGGVAPMVYIDMGSNTNLGAMLPADADGNRVPPAGTPNYFVQFDDDGWGFPQDQLEVYEFAVDWTTPANSTFTVSPNSPLAVTPFTTLNGTTIPQPGTAQKLDNLGDRLMYRLQYRNFGTYQSMVVNHTVDTTGTGDGEAGIRWYELRDTGSNWVIGQQGTYAGDSPDDKHRWMGSIAQDSQGNMAVGYSVSNATDTYPSIRYVGRLVGDTVGTLPQGESEIITGSGSQTGSAARWGDYSMMSVDPVDDCTFWYTQEYYETTSATGWQTRIASFKFPSCTAGASGTLEGTVADASAAPLSGAMVSVDGGSGLQFSTTTAADGSYHLNVLPVGSYTVTAVLYGYSTSSISGVVVTEGITTTQDFTLTALPVYTLNGTIKDKNTGWPLYAEVNYGHGSVWTNPSTGIYSVNLPQGVQTITATADNYGSETATLTLNGNQSQDFLLLPDAGCSASGYSLSQTTVLSENFNGCTLPAGWTINNLGGDCQWQISDPDPGVDGNLTGGTGCFADADIDFCGEGKTMNTELITPVVNCSTLSAVTLEFKYDLDDTWAESATYDADVSTDNGSTWTTVWTRSGTAEAGTAAIDITAQAAGHTSVQVRFHYLANDWDFWWQVDDVSIYEPVCNPPTGGGLVIGHVYDGNTGTALNGALVDDNAGHSVNTIATPTDDTLDDGFYSLYLPTSGAASLEATKDRYEAVTTSVTVPVLGTVAHSFNLPAGRLSAIPESFEVHMAMNTTLNADLSMVNSGGVDAAFQFNEMYAELSVPPDGPFADQVRHVSPKHLDDKDASGARYDYPVLDVPVFAAAGAVVTSWPSTLSLAWGIDHQNSTATLWLGNLGDDVDYEFNQSGTASGNTIAVGEIGASWMADFTYDWLNQTLWQVAVGGDNCIHELDPDTRTVTGSTICPAFGSSQRGLAYNPKTDTFYAGGWNDTTIHEFDRNGTILRSTNVGLAISGLAFNPSTDHLFVMVNRPASEPEIYVVDVPAGGDFVVSSQFDIAGFSDNGGAGLAMDCDGRLWTVDQQTQTVYQVDSGEVSTCSLDIPWLTVTPSSGTATPASQEPVVLTFDSSGISAGTEEKGYLTTTNSTPYGYFNIPVTMVVEPNQLLSVSTTGDGAGTVAADSGSVNCGTTCSGEYPYNTTVLLTATADSGANFLGWTGDCVGSADTCTVVMDQARNVSAAFGSTTSDTSKDLTVGITGSGTGGVVSAPAGIACGTAGSTWTASFTDDTLVTLTATATPGSTFMGWTGACSGNDTCTVTMNQNQYVSATFTDSASPTSKELVVNVSGNGQGGVISTPVAIFCGTAGNTCTAPFDDGASVVLTATPASGSVLLWSGDCAGSNLTCNLDMTQDHAVTATFAQAFSLTVNKDGKGNGTVVSEPSGISCGNDCRYLYGYGTQVVLTATPDKHSALEAWLGSCSEPVTNPPSLTCTVDIFQAEEITVTFKPVFPWPMFVPAIIHSRN
ncbi:MAG: carboxypeptidase regulatory-like domain-containing protein [Desulfocapsaceae bacterium]|nr:carboxypeptidase regulatory-like domain-containing protein [Desulfocapsaceae bacterium]